MMKTIKTIGMAQLILAIAMTVPATANAQSTTSNSVSIDRLSLQSSGSAKLVRVGAQVKDDLFAGAEKFAQGASEVAEINLDPSTMGMIGRHGSEAALSSKLNFMVIHSYQYDKPGMYSMDDFQAFTKKLTDGTWNCSIHVREKSSSTDICSRTAADHESNEMVILTAEPKEITFIHMSGKMSLSDLSRMSEGSHGIRLPSSTLTTRPPVPSVPPVPAVPPVPSATSR